MIIVIQKFIKNLGNTLETLIKIILLSKYSKTLPSIGKEKTCIIMGNGPSLSESLKRQGFIENKVLFCVNYFPKTGKFEKLKPEYLVITAPELWLDDVDERFKTNSKVLFQTIANKVNWEFVLFIPTNARRYLNWKSEIVKNKKIRIQYYNVTPAEGYKWFKHFLFKMNLGMPRPHNVLIPTLMLSINMGFKDIYLLGADHSWLSAITVNDKNEVLINDKHFYDEHKSETRLTSKKGRGVKKLHEVLQKYYYSFHSYFIIEKYAEKNGAKISNATPNSYIDAFEKVNLNKIK